jgi:prepilin-type N-terminal cleavage/methylation domain-containing protein
MRFFLLRNNKGFTLIELSIAATILAFGILGYTLLKSSNRYSSQYSKETSQAVHITRGQLEEFIATNFDSDLLTAGTHSYTTEIDPTLPQIGDFQLTNAQWQVRNGCPSEYTKTIDFTATWSTGGAAKQLTLTHVMVEP